MLDRVAPARQAVRMAAWHAKEIGREDPEAALRLLETCLGVSRHVNQDGLLIHLLTSVAMEGIAWSIAEELAGGWEKQDRQRLLEIVQSQTPGFSLADAVAREAEQTLNRMSDALFSAPDTAWLIDLVRISSIAILPGETWIALEHAGLGVSFHLSPGETRHGIELVSFDRENNRAVIRWGDEEAVVHLESRRLRPIDPPALLRLMGIEADGEVAQRLTQEPEDTGWFEPPDLRDILTGEESDAEVALILFHEMKAAYELKASFASAPFGALPTDRRRDVHPAFGATDTDRDPRDGFDFPEVTSAFAAEIASIVLRLRPIAERTRTHRDMLETALRLLDDPGAPIPNDPFSADGDEPLIVSRGDDWVEIRSRFEMAGHRTHSVRLGRRED